MAFNGFNDFIIFSKDDTTIISGKKLGNRFLTNTKLFSIIRNNDLKFVFENSKKVYWIIREPKEHMLSALVTELNSYIKNNENPQQITKKIKTKNSEDAWIFDVIQKLINVKLGKLTSSSEIGDKFSSHFSFGYYNQLYNNLIQEYFKYYKVIFIDIRNLSNLINGVYDSTFQYVESTYNLDFKYKDFIINKETIQTILEENFAEEWKELNDLIVIETEFYEKVKNFDYPKFLIDKIHHIVAKIEDQFNDKLIDINDLFVKEINKISKLLKNTKL